MRKLLVGLFLTCMMASAVRAVTVHWWVDADDLSGVSDVLLVYSANDVSGYADPYASSQFTEVGSGGAVAWDDSKGYSGIGDSVADSSQGGGYYHLLLKIAQDWSEYKYASFSWDDSRYVQFMTGNPVWDAMEAAGFDESVTGFTVVPEPSTMALLSLGVAALLLRRRKAL